MEVAIGSCSDTLIVVMALRQPVPGSRANGLPYRNRASPVLPTFSPWLNLTSLREVCRWLTIGDGESRNAAKRWSRPWFDSLKHKFILEQVYGNPPWLVSIFRGLLLSFGLFGQVSVFFWE